MGFCSERPWIPYQCVYTIFPKKVTQNYHIHWSRAQIVNSLFFIPRNRLTCEDKLTRARKDIPENKNNLRIPGKERGYLDFSYILSEKNKYSIISSFLKNYIPSFLSFSDIKVMHAYLWNFNCMKSQKWSCNLLI